MVVTNTARSAESGTANENLSARVHPGESTIWPVTKSANHSATAKQIYKADAGALNYKLCNEVKAVHPNRS